MLAVGTGRFLELAHAQLRGTDFEPALAPILEELRRPQDRIDDRADERKQRGGGRASDENRILDPPPGVEERPGDQRDPKDHEEQDQQVDGQVEGVVGDSE